VVTELERYCDYVVILNQGRLQVAGDVDEVLNEQRRLAGPTSLEDFVLEYLRDPERRRLTSLEVVHGEAAV
jgi:ABC-type multidrug transport system ATPase subunit